MVEDDSSYPKVQLSTSKDEKRTERNKTSTGTAFSKTTLIPRPCSNFSRFNNTKKDHCLALALPTGPLTTSQQPKHQHKTTYQPSTKSLPTPKYPDKERAKLRKEYHPPQRHSTLNCPKHSFLQLMSSVKAENHPNVSPSLVRDESDVTPTEIPPNDQDYTSLWNLVRANKKLVSSIPSSSSYPAMSAVNDRPKPASMSVRQLDKRGIRMWSLHYIQINRSGYRDSPALYFNCSAIASKATYAIHSISKAEEISQALVSIIREDSPTQEETFHTLMGFFFQDPETCQEISEGHLEKLASQKDRTTPHFVSPGNKFVSAQHEESASTQEPNEWATEPDSSAIHTRSRTSSLKAQRSETSKVSSSATKISNTAQSNPSVSSKNTPHIIYKLGLRSPLNHSSEPPALIPMTHATSPNNHPYPETRKLPQAPGRESFMSDTVRPLCRSDFFHLLRPAAVFSRAVGVHGTLRGTVWEGFGMVRFTWLE